MLGENDRANDLLPIFWHTSVIGVAHNERECDVHKSEASHRVSHVSGIENVQIANHLQIHHTIHLLLYIFVLRMMRV